MTHSTVPSVSRKRIALIAHNNRKGELLEWARRHLRTLAHHELYATNTTGCLLKSELGVSVTCFLSGPLGGDQQVGAALVEGRIDIVIFFWDPLEAQPHDADVKALLRVAVVHNVPVACNLATADFLLSSPLMDRDVVRRRLKEKSHRYVSGFPERGWKDNEHETIATHTHSAARTGGPAVCEHRNRVPAA